MPASRRRRWLVCWAVLSIVLLGRLTLRSAWPIAARPFATPILIDLNRADVATLMTLPGIGRSRAAAIVLRRVRHGPFRDPTELLQIDGFGELGLARLRHFLQPIPPVDPR